MCLITRQKKAKITKKDLVVFKCLNNGDISVSRYFPWIEGQLVKCDLKIIKREHPSNNHGGDWFYADHITNGIYNGLSNCYAISVGLHACTTKERAKRLADCYDTNIIEEFLIPKGSEVFYDVTGLIVSNQMMML